MMTSPSLRYSMGAVDPGGEAGGGDFDVLIAEEARASI